MASTALPLAARISSRIRPRDFVALAVREEVLHPGQARWAPPPINLPDERDRIIACNRATPHLEIARLSEGWQQHGPTVVRTFRDAVLLDGTVYVKGGYLAVRPSQRRVVTIPSWVAEEDGLLCSTQVVNRYFGHWLTDGLPLERLAQELGVEAVTVEKPRWLHEPGYRAMTGSADRPTFSSRFRTLRIADDRGLNDHWLGRMGAIRGRMAAAIGTAAGPRRPVFVARGATGVGRSLANEGELIEAMDGWGFAILRPEQAEPDAIARVLHDASVVVAVEGSAQAHAMLAVRAGTPLVSIMPPRHFTSIFKPICDALGLPWAYTVADDRGDDAFHQPVDRLRRLLDRVEGAGA